MEQKTNPYKLLGLDVDAPMLVIKAAYKALMKSKGHPDIGGSSYFAQELNEAYQILTDEDKKRELDSSLKTQTQTATSKNIYYALCIHCQTINSISNPQVIKQAKCYQCHRFFMKDNVSEQKFEQKNSFSKKEQINEKLADEFFNRKMYYRAIREYNLLISKDSKNAYYYFYMMGLCYYQQSQFREGLKHFLKSLERKNDFWQASIEAGKTLMQMFQYSDALSHFEKCLPNASQPHKVKTHIGICFYKMGMFRKAILKLVEVVDIDPTFEQAIYLLALAFYQMHDFSNAKKYFLLAKFHYNDNEKIKEMIDYCNARLVRMKEKNGL